ncbi:unnamed protein product [Symbiodinium natans]|uniref:Uncharacterized protein n=1 Tax=Symbiodinium natans TaxID=878477 RepID=A0A812GW92_9DINO|nr:unnamed protein product [Symbiodinium natans]
MVAVSPLNVRKQPARGRRSDLKEASEFCQKHSVDPASGRLRRRDETGGDSAPKREIADEPVVPKHDEDELDEETRQWISMLMDWSELDDDFPLPIQPVGLTGKSLVAVEEARGGQRKDTQDHMPMYFSNDTLLFCYDAPDLTYDEHFSRVVPEPWRFQFWARGKDSSIAVRGLHDHPVFSCALVYSAKEPSRKCTQWMRHHYDLEGFNNPDAEYIVTHSMDTTVIWRLDHLWEVAEEAALGNKQDPSKKLEISQTKESPSLLSESSAELWLKTLEGMYPVQRDKLAGCFAIVGEYLPGQRSPNYRPDDHRGGVVMREDRSGLLILSVARGPEVEVYAVTPKLDVIPMALVDADIGLTSCLEIVFPEGPFRGLRARLQPDESATPPYKEENPQESSIKDSPPQSLKSSKSSKSQCSTPPGDKSPGNTPPSSPVKDAQPKSKIGSGQHQVCTPRGASFQSTNIGRGSLPRQVSSRGTETPASPSRVQVSRVGVRQGHQSDGRLAVGVRISDKSRPLTSQGTKTKTPSTTQIAGRRNDSRQSSTSLAPTSSVRVSERRSNSPRGRRGETRSTTSSGMVSGSRDAAVRSAGHRLVTNLSGGSPTSQISASKTVRRDVKPLVKAATSEGVRLRSRSVSSDNADRRGQAVSPKLAETPPRPESVEPATA